MILLVARAVPTCTEDVDTDSQVWDSSSEPTEAELEERVQLDCVHDFTPEEVAERVLAFKPPPDATWPEDS